MKQYTTKEQTAKLIEMGFPEARRKEWQDKDGHWHDEETYSIGELIEFLGEHLLDVGVATVIRGLPIRHFVRFTKDRTTNGWVQVQGELIDKLFTAV